MTNRKCNVKATKRCRSLRLGGTGGLWGNPKHGKRNYTPGQHSKQNSRMSDYGVQLNAKQKLKFYYGKITETQMSNICKRAMNMKGDAVDNLVSLLERRLDMVVYRAGFANSIFAAAQVVSHGHVMVNGKKVNIRSYSVKPGDVISVRDSFKSNVNFMEAFKKSESSGGNGADYVKVDYNEYSCEFLRTPTFSEIPYAVKMDPQMVIEYYSR